MSRITQVFPIHALEQIIQYIEQADRQFFCNTCDIVYIAAVRIAGEFSYNFENEEMDFSEGNMPRKFGNLKPDLSPASCNL